MKKLLLFVILSMILTSCVVTTRPQPNVVVKPTYKRYWYKPWYGPKHYQHHPPKHRHH